jgi:phytol kinase
MNPIVALLLVVTVLAGAYGVLHVLGQHFQWSAELRRKSVHITLGLVCLSFPWLFSESWPVILIGGIAIISLTLLRLLPKTGDSIASGLHSVPRDSLGELFFAAVVVWTFINARDNLVLYLVPIAILTLADAGGALLGVRYGRKRFSTLGSGKTIEGSLTFFLIAVLCTFLPLLIFTELPLLHICLASAILGGLATLVEGFSSHGFDNLLLPIACLLILEVFLTLSSETLIIRLVVLGNLVVILGLLRKFTSLDGGGLLSCMLFGYACFALGNIFFLLIGLLFYVLHLFATYQVTKTHEVEHRIDSVIAITSTGLVWLSCHRLGILPTGIALLCFALGMAAHITMMHCGTSFFLEKRAPGYPKALLKGALFIVLGITGALVFYSEESTALTVPTLVKPVIAALVFIALLLPTAALFVLWRGRSPDSRSLYHLKKTLLALPYSALGLLTASIL